MWSSVVVISHALLPSPRRGIYSGLRKSLPFYRFALCFGGFHDRSCSCLYSRPYSCLYGCQYCVRRGQAFHFTWWDNFCSFDFVGQWVSLCPQACRTSCCLLLQVLVGLDCPFSSACQPRINYVRVNNENPQISQTSWDLNSIQFPPEVSLMLLNTHPPTNQGKIIQTSSLFIAQCLPHSRTVGMRDAR